jgi:splicing factor 3B subunit 2
MALPLLIFRPPNAPPPWLINMQRYGPPPAYPKLAIPGLNAPIPEGAQWGFHPGGWGKPPVDDFNRPLYGDVFAEGGSRPKVAKQHAMAGKKYWGEIIEEQEMSSDEEDSDAESEEEEVVRAPLAALEGDQVCVLCVLMVKVMAIESYESEGMETPSGLASVTGIETPDHINLRKDVKVSSAPRSLYTVLPSQERQSNGFMGSSHGYDITSSVDVSLDPEELDLEDQELLRKKMDEVGGKKKGPAVREYEDLSDMVNDHVGGKKRKADDKEKKGKSGKSFKF